MFSPCFWQNLAPDYVLGNRRGLFTPTSSLPSVVLHQCNIVESHSHLLIYRGGRGEENIISLMQFRKNSTFLVYSPHSLLQSRHFLGSLEQPPDRQCSSVPTPCGHLWLSAPAACGDEINEAGEHWDPVHENLAFLSHWLSFLRLVLKAGKNMVDKKPFQGLDGSFFCISLLSNQSHVLRRCELPHRNMFTSTTPSPWQEGFLSLPICEFLFVVLWADADSQTCFLPGLVWAVQGLSLVGAGRGERVLIHLHSQRIHCPCTYWEMNHASQKQLKMPPKWLIAWLPP